MEKNEFVFFLQNYKKKNKTKQFNMALSLRKNTSVILPKIESPTMIFLPNNEIKAGTFIISKEKKLKDEFAKKER